MWDMIVDTLEVIALIFTIIAGFAALFLRKPLLRSVRNIERNTRPWRAARQAGRGEPPPGRTPASAARYVASPNRNSGAAAAGERAINAAIDARRDPDLAHRLYEKAGDSVYRNPQALLEFAQTKRRLAGKAHREGKSDQNQRLLTEAMVLADRVIQHPNSSPDRCAWAWRELAITRHWLRRPTDDVEEAWRSALELRPDDPQFLLEFAQTKRRLAGKAYRERKSDQNQRLLMEVMVLADRVIQHPNSSPDRCAWAWRELAITRHWLRRPTDDVEEAWRCALELRPDDPQFLEEREKMRIERRL